ncbi:MAG TPA: hypothetical protein VMK12_23245 [Anaeromyxobacteraceae bacterium]|nr:hypothetical protein [Anaeromyxobacteraceae bacterium]
MQGLKLAVLCALAACVPRVRESGPEREYRAIAGGVPFTIVYLRGDEAVGRDLLAALAWAAPRAQRWGPLRVPVTITVHPTHEALELAAGRSSYGWLRAWARYSTIEVQSPRTWSASPSPQELEQFMAHELTHCAMYQSVADERSWVHKAVPLWFREGMASVTAEQGHRRAGPESVREFYAAAATDNEASGGSEGGEARTPRGDPLSDPERLYRSEDEIVYGTAHLAFGFLLDRYGEDRIRRLLRLMRQGDPFPEAFRGAIGIGAEEFENEFRRYIVWHGFRSR